MNERGPDAAPDDEAEVPDGDAEVPWGEMGRGVPAGLGGGDPTQEEGAQADEEAVSGGGEDERE